MNYADAPYACVNNMHLYSVNDYRLKHLAGMKMNRSGPVFAHVSNTFESFAAMFQLHGSTYNNSQSSLLIRLHLQAGYQLVARQIFYADHETPIPIVNSIMNLFDKEQQLIVKLKETYADITERLELSEVSDDSTDNDKAYEICMMLSKRLHKSTIIMLYIDMFMFEHVFGIILDPVYFFIKDKQFVFNRVTAKRSSAFVNYVILDYYNFGWILPDPVLFEGQTFPVWKRQYTNDSIVEKQQYVHDRMAYVTMTNVHYNNTNTIHMNKIGQLPGGDTPENIAKNKKDFENRLFVSVANSKTTIESLREKDKFSLLKANHLDESEELWTGCCKTNCELGPTDIKSKCCVCDTAFHQECYPLRVGELVLFCKWECVQRAAQNILVQYNKQRKPDTRDTTVATNPAPCEADFCTMAQVVPLHWCGECRRPYHEQCLNSLKYSYFDVVMFCSPQCLERFRDNQTRQHQKWKKDQQQKVAKKANQPTKLRECNAGNCDLKHLPRTVCCDRCYKWVHSECCMKIVCAADNTMNLNFLQ